MRHVIAVGLCAAALSPAALAAPSPLGNWARVDGGSKIRIAPCGANLCAVNTWVKDPQGSEKIGDTLVLMVKPQSATVLVGQAFDKRRDMTYRMTMTLDQDKLQTHGCVLVGLLCKSAEWARSP